MSVYTEKTEQQRQRQRDQTRAAELRRRREQPRREMLKALKYAARTMKSRRGRVEFNLTEDDVHWPTHCPVFGLELHYPGHFHHDPAGASFDRLDFDVGYVRGNVIVVSLRANLLRKNATAAELRALADFYSAYEFLE